MRIDAILNAADLEILRYDPEHRSYYPVQVRVILQPHQGAASERYIGFGANFDYYVLEVIEGGPAQRLGMEPGEFIESINGRRVPNLQGRADLDNSVRKIASNPTETIVIELARWKMLENGKANLTTRKVQGNL